MVKDEQSKWSNWAKLDQENVFSGSFVELKRRKENIPNSRPFNAENTA